jgi:hypothetical protein
MKAKLICLLFIHFLNVFLLAQDKFSLEGIDEMPLSGSVMQLGIFGENSAPLIYQENDSSYHITMATSQYGKGKILVVSHDSQIMVRHPEHELFFDKLLEWFGLEKKRGVKVVSHPGVDIPATLASRATIKTYETIPSRNSDIIFVYDTRIKHQKEVDNILKAVDNGSNVIFIAMPWIRESSGYGEKLLNQFGIEAITESFLNLPEGNRIFIPRNYPNDLHSGYVYKKLKEDASVEQLSYKGIQLLTRTLTEIHPESCDWIKDVYSWIGKENHITQLFKEESKELQLLRNAFYSLTFRKNRLKDPKDITASQLASIFPGLPGENSKFIDKSINFRHHKKAKGAFSGNLVPQINPILLKSHTHQWLSTGLYAAPGQSINIKVDRDMVDHLQIRIGAHSDHLYHKEELKRAPIVSIVYDINSEETVINSEFGGLIYVIDLSDKEYGVFNLKFKNVLQAAYYIKGETTNEEWIKMLYHVSAPWGELASNNVIITLPLENLKNLNSACQKSVVFCKNRNENTFKN